MRKALFCVALAMVATPLLAYTVYLKDGKTITAREPYRIEGDSAIIVLQNGTHTSIQADEIDVERTRSANQSNLGSALELEGGQVTEYTPRPDAGRDESLSDMLARRPNSALSRPPARRPDTTPEPTAGAVRSMAGYLDYQSLPRRPYHDLDVASELQTLFRAQGVEQVVLFQGTESGHLLAEFVANSEASVFRSLRTAAGALLHLRENYPGTVNAMEVMMSTSNREPAGQFLLTPDSAALIAGEQVEMSEFFVRQVRF